MTSVMLPDQDRIGAEQILQAIPLPAENCLAGVAIEPLNPKETQFIANYVDAGLDRRVLADNIGTSYENVNRAFTRMRAKYPLNTTQLVLRVIDEGLAFIPPDPEALKLMGTLNSEQADVASLLVTGKTGPQIDEVFGWAPQSGRRVLKALPTKLGLDKRPFPKIQVAIQAYYAGRVVVDWLSRANGGTGLTSQRTEDISQAA